MVGNIIRRLINIDLYTELQQQVDLLQKSLEKLKETGRSYASAEKEYKVLLRQEVLKMRDNGEAIGVITLTCYGIPSVAEARFKRDVAESLYKANQEAIQTYKLKIRLIESQIQREYTSTRYE